MLGKLQQIEIVSHAIVIFSILQPLTKTQNVDDLDRSNKLKRFIEKWFVELSSQVFVSDWKIWL